jgi:hypothetical protein
MGESTPPSKRGAESRPTADLRPDLDRVRRARNVRRVSIGILFAFIGLGAGGVFGARTSTVSTTAEGYDLTVTYPAVTRPGLAIRWAITVRHAGGFSDPIELSTTSEYLDMFDENGLDPDPAEATTTDDETVWTFDLFESDVLTVSFDARVEPARESGGTGTTTLSVEGRDIAMVRYRTWVMP